MGPHPCVLQVVEGRQQLLAILAQRNKQLQQAEERVAALSERLEQQQDAAEAQLAAASSRQQAAALKADKVKNESMKQVIVLEVSAGTWMAAVSEWGPVNVLCTHACIHNGVNLRCSHPVTAQTCSSQRPTQHCAPVFARCISTHVPP